MCIDLHDSYNPSFFVMVVQSHDSGLREIKVSVEKVEVISKHDQQPTRNEYQIKIILIESHASPFSFFFFFPRIKSFVLGFLFL